MGDLRWIASVAGGQLPLRDRNALLHETGATGAPEFFGSPGVFQFIRGHSGPGDTLVWNVTTFHGLLWNRSYSNRVVHLPATPRDCYPGNAALLTEPTTEEMERWLSEIDHRKPRHILVYAKSACARSMQERPEHGYHVVFEDPPSRDGAMIIFQRTAQEY